MQEIVKLSCVLTLRLYVDSTLIIAYYEAIYFQFHRINLCKHPPTETSCGKVALRS